MEARAQALAVLGSIPSLSLSVLIHRMERTICPSQDDPRVRCHSPVSAGGSIPTSSLPCLVKAEEFSRGFQRLLPSRKTQQLCISLGFALNHSFPVEISETLGCLRKWEKKTKPLTAQEKQRGWATAWGPWTRRIPSSASRTCMLVQSLAWVRDLGVPEQHFPHQ